MSIIAFLENEKNIKGGVKEVVIRPALLALILLVLSGTSAFAEVIRDFDADILLFKNGTLDIKENITMDFEGSHRHGIYRDIPVRFRRHGNGYTTPLRVISVRDENDRPVQYKVTDHGQDVRIRIGDPDNLTTGTHVYRINYRVRRAVNFFAGEPEVYWNVTGASWPYPIERAEARLMPPRGVSLSGVQLDSYRGYLGSKDPADARKAGSELLYSTGELAPGQGLTIVARLPKGAVIKPTFMDAIKDWLIDWWPAVVLPGLALGIIMPLWASTGRDEEGGKAVAVEWEPPAGLTPAEVGTLVDEHCDNKDIVATLIDLAARGYLKIEEKEASRLLFLSNKDYLFKRQNDPPIKPGKNDPLKPHEKYFLDKVFDGRTSRYLSELKEKFHKHVEHMKDDIYASLHFDGFFKERPDVVRNSYQFAGSAFIIFFVFMMGNSASWATGSLLTGLIILGFSRAMPAKTRKGSKELRHIQGFKRFLEMAEKQRIEKLVKDDPTIFGRMLPFALSLGVADQWADKFEGLLTEPPDWYVPYGSYHFTTRGFVGSLGSGMHTMSSTFTSQPASSGGSGMGGGGFSGGGFGGGGGGSW